ncbi:hypothetical protein CRG98_047974, partial [Punica granatum]
GLHEGSDQGGEKGNEVRDTDFEANDYDESVGNEFECDELSNDGDDEYIAALANLRNYRLRKSKGESSSGGFEQVEREGLHDVQFEGEGLHDVQVMEATEEEPPVEAHSDYALSNDEVMTPENSEDEGKKTKRTNKGKPYTGKGDDEFCLKMRFESSQQFRQAVQDYAVKNGKSIRWVRSGVKKAEARCAKNCPWKIYGRQTQRKDAFVVTIYDPEHRCYRSARNRQASSEWLANHYLERFRQNPDWSITEMMNNLDVKFALKVTKIVCYRARAKAFTIIRGSLGEHYNLLPSYIAELKR